jgi:hypothetical protein
MAIYLFFFLLLHFFDPVLALPSHGHRARKSRSVTHSLSLIGSEHPRIRFGKEKQRKTNRFDNEEIDLSFKRNAHIPLVNLVCF